MPKRIIIVFLCALYVSLFFAAPTRAAAKNLLRFKEQKSVSSDGVIRWKATRLTGRYLKKVKVRPNQFGGWMIYLKFNKKGAKYFEQITARNIGKPLAIFLNKELIATPLVQEKLETGEAVIVGNFSKEEAEILAHDLRLSRR